MQDVFQPSIDYLEHTLYVGMDLTQGKRRYIPSAIR
jgi:hypothetical protein